MFVIGFMCYCGFGHCYVVRYLVSFLFLILQFASAAVILRRCSVVVVVVVAAAAAAAAVVVVVVVVVFVVVDSLFVIGLIYFFVCLVLFMLFGIEGRLYFFQSLRWKDRVMLFRTKCSF